MCAHKVKLAAHNISVPLKQQDGRMFLASGGVPTKIKKVVFCADACCEQVFVITSPDFERKLSLVK